MEELLRKILNNPNSVIALCSLAISILAMIVSILFAVYKVRHNKKSVQPIGLIKFNDREDYISVDIRNAGIGPLIIKNLKVYMSNDKKKRLTADSYKSNLIDWLPQHPEELPFSDFIEHVNVFVIPANDMISLIEIEFNGEHPEIETTYREELRNALKELTVELNYNDIYDRKFKITRDCDWFGRPL